MTAKERVLWILAATAALVAGLFAGSWWGKSLDPASTEENAEIGSSGAAPTDGFPAGGGFRFVAANPSLTASGAPFPDSQSSEDMAVFTRETLREPNTLKRMAAYTNLLANMTAENYQAVERNFEAERKQHGRVLDQEWSMYLERAGEVVGQPFLDRLYAEERLSDARLAITGWAISDPGAAVDWLETVPESKFRDRIWGASVRGIATSDPDLALRLLDQLPFGQRKVYTGDLTAIMIQTAGVQGASDAFDEAVRRAEANGELEGVYLERIFRPLMERRLGRSKLTDAENWARSHFGQPYTDESFYNLAARTIAKDSPEAAMAFLEEATNASHTSNGYNGFVWAWIDKYGTDAVGNWLNENESHRLRDLIASKFVRQIATKDAEAAAAWLETIEDPTLQAEALQQLKEKGVEYVPFAP